MFSFKTLTIKNEKKISNKEKFIKNPIQFVLHNRFYLKYPTIIPLFPFEDNILKLSSIKYDTIKIMDEINIAQSNNKNNNLWISKGKSNIWDSITIKSKNGEEQPYLEEVDFNLEYKYTEFGAQCNYIKEILDSLNTKIYLVRILKLSPNSKVSWHTDEIVFKNINNIIRCHIPIKTNKDCKMLIGHPLKEPEKNNIWEAETLLESHLEEGYIYYTNVNALHSVYNSSDSERIHLVIDLKPTEKYLQLIFK